MRASISGLVMALVVSGSAAGADLSDPVWTQAPERDAWAKAYPAQAAQARIAGSVRLRCKAAADGSLQNCSVASETPVGEGFGAAALSLAGGMQLRTTSTDGSLIAGRQVEFPIKFDPALLKPPTIVSNPDWLRRPTDRELYQYYPAAARGAAGQTLLMCVVTGRGLLDATEESPAGHGFGAASLAMAQLFLMRPMTADGQPVGGSRVRIPIGYEAGPPAPVSDASQTVTTLRVLSAAPWLTTPTPEQVAAAFPSGAIGKIASAHVVLRCALTPEGELSSCDDVSETPGGKGFATAARSLTRDFRAMVNAKTDKLDSLRVDVAFDFRDPTRPAPPLEIYDPIWLRQLNPQALLAYYPVEATKAGIKSGAAKVVCTVAHDGGLNDCSIADESPAGMGFGQLALKAAGVMQMNPWTRQGTPVDGARIALPIKFVMPNSLAAHTPPKP